jgi:ribonuclease HI
MSNNLHTTPPRSHTTSSPTHPPGSRLPFTAVTANCARSSACLHSLMDSLKDSPPDILLLQEIFCYNNSLPSIPGFSAIAPLNTTTPSTPLAAIYVSAKFLNSFAYTRLNIRRADVTGITITPRLPGSQPLCSVLSVYNHVGQHHTQNHSLAPYDPLFNYTNLPCLIAGDFNLHSPIWDPFRSFNRHEAYESRPLEKAALDAGFSLISPPAIPTRFGWGRPSVLDLGFASTNLLPLFSNSEVLENFGSDHLPVAFHFNAPFTPSSRPTPNWKIFDINKVKDDLQNIYLPPIHSVSEEWIDTTLLHIRSTLSRSVPVKRTTKWSKPWWTPELTALRKDYRTLAHSTPPPPAATLRAARTTYTSAIHIAKKKHWNEFLLNANEEKLWKAVRYRKPKSPNNLPSFPNTNTPTELATKLVQSFFPPTQPTHTVTNHTAPPISQVPPVTANELSYILSRANSSSCPGPDSIPFSVWKEIHNCRPSLIPHLITACLQLGLHPRSLHHSNGVVLPKPNKADYTSPKSFRVIVLLDTFSKIIERIIQHRLTPIAHQLQLLHPHQTGALPGSSTGDALARLFHEVDAIQASKRKASTVFLDIKGGFDHVNHQILTARLREKGTPEYITQWVASFLSNRSINLLFPGSPDLPIPISVGVPQGSAISPLLFNIYVAPIHNAITNAFDLSYIDDFSLTVASDSYTDNQTVISDLVYSLTNLTTSLNLTFSSEKTEFIHWETRCQRIKSPTTPFQLYDRQITPATKLKWLGTWLDPRRTPQTNSAPLTAAAASTLTLIRTLATTGTGLRPRQCHRLITGILQPRILHNAHLYNHTHSSLTSLNTIWNHSARWMLGAFRSTPISSLLIEACLPPLEVLFRAEKLRYAYRIACLPPQFNVASAALPLDFPSHHPHRDTHSFQSFGNLGARTPNLTAWNHPSPSQKPKYLFLHSLAKHLLPWSHRGFPAKFSPQGPRPLSNPTFPTKDTFNPSTIFPSPPPANALLLYSDGSLSVNDDGRHVGAGFVALQNNITLHTGSFPLPPHWGVFDAELFAALKALIYATTITPPPSDVYLHIDNQAAIYSIARPSSTSSAKLVQMIIDSVRSLINTGTTTHLGWTPGHIGIEGNELADAAAKLGASLPPPLAGKAWTSSSIRPLIRSQLIADWSLSYSPRPDYPYHPSTTPTPIFDLPRMQASRLFQIRLAKSYLSAHTDWAHPHTTECERCLEEIETPEHAILTCPARGYARTLFPPGLTLAEAYSSPNLLKTVGRYITRTKTGYPPDPTVLTPQTLPPIPLDV